MTLPGPATSHPQEDTEWTLAALQTLLELKGVVHAVVLTGDGLIKGSSPGLSREAAEGTAAVTAGLQSCARAVAGALSGLPDTKPRQVVIETGDGFVFSVPAGEHTHLVLYTTRDTDMGHVTYEVHRLVAKLGERVLRSPARDALE